MNIWTQMILNANYHNIDGIFITDEIGPEFVKNLIELPLINKMSCKIFSDNTHMPHSAFNIT